MLKTMFKIGLKKKKAISYLSLWMILLSIVNPIYSAKINLFEKNREAPKQIKEDKQAKPKQKLKGSQLNKELIAIQRMGNQYKLTLRNNKGVKEYYHWQRSENGEAEQVEIETGHSIESITNRQILLKLDSKITCKKNKIKEISCPKKGYQILTLKRNKAKKTIKRAPKKMIRLLKK